jgi:hypothetical protein
MTATTSERQESVSPLADDLLAGAEKIAAYSGESVRRTRHLMAVHGLPHFKRGGLIYSRKSWLDRYFSGEGQ